MEVWLWKIVSGKISTFVCNFKSNDYQIGDYDENEAIKLIIDNHKICYENALKLIKKFSKNQTATIFDKNKAYVGFITYLKSDESILLETKEVILTFDVKEIINLFKKYLKENSEINNVKEIVYRSEKFLYIIKKTSI